MKNKIKILLLFALFLFAVKSYTQEGYEKKVEVLKAQKEKITEQEKEALKQEVKDINRRLERGDISEEEADILKETAAKKRALNIEN
ncbi:MAG: hypothetical protein AAFQ20_06375, partial [Bacteroidota bacterium]